jgi:hypothetical protein
MRHHEINGLLLMSMQIAGMNIELRLHCSAISRHRDLRHVAGVAGMDEGGDAFWEFRRVPGKKFLSSPGRFFNLAVLRAYFDERLKNRLGANNLNQNNMKRVLD